MSVTPRCCCTMAAWLRSGNPSSVCALTLSAVKMRPRDIARRNGVGYICVDRECTVSSGICNRKYSGVSDEIGDELPEVRGQNSAVAEQGSEFAAAAPVLTLWCG